MYERRGKSGPVTTRYDHRFHEGWARGTGALRLDEPLTVGWFGRGRCAEGPIGGIPESNRSVKCISRFYSLVVAMEVELWFGRKQKARGEAKKVLMMRTNREGGRKEANTE